MLQYFPNDISVIYTGDDLRFATALFTLLYRVAFGSIEKTRISLWTYVIE